MKPIAKERFEALTAYTRQPPAAGVFSKELEWYASDNEILLAAIIIDLDDEYSAIILMKPNILRPDVLGCAVIG